MGYEFMIIYSKLSDEELEKKFGFLPIHLVEPIILRELLCRNTIAWDTKTLKRITFRDFAKHQIPEELWDEYDEFHVARILEQ